jgi:hypothetical protein
MQQQKLFTIIEWTGSLIGVSAAILLALNIPISAWAYVFYLLSSILLLIWSVREQAHGLAFQNFVFIAINLLGIYRWLIVP